MAYSFDGVELPFVQSAICPLSSRIPAADTPARPGGYLGKRLAGERTASVMGTIQAASSAALQTAWSDFAARHDVGTPRALILRDGWFYYAVPDTLTPSEWEPGSVKYEVDYKIGDPYAYSTTQQAAQLAPSGTTSITPGGNKFVLPTLSLVVSSIGTGGYFTITNAATGETCYLYPSATQTYTIASRTETVSGGPIADFSGQWLSLLPGVANALTITPSGGASLSSASQILWRDRSV